MNVLTFVFSILLILAFGNLAIREKQMASRRIVSTYLGHTRAGKNLLTECERETFKSFGSAPKQKKEQKPRHQTKKKREVKQEAKRKINPACARLNLQPLIDEGKEKHPFLYELTAKLLKTFYGAQFFQKARSEYDFLDAWIAAARGLKCEEVEFAFEKITFKDPSEQTIYYKLLKGTKAWSLAEKNGYPALVDYVAFYREPSLICVGHADRDLLTVLFNAKAAQKLYAEIHREKPAPLTRELIERLCFESQIIQLDPEIYPLLQLGRPKRHKAAKTTFVAEDEDSHIQLKKTVYTSTT